MAANYDGKTHRLVKSPQISVARLADYMGASEQARRTILQSCKYQPSARVIQHNDAKTIITQFLRTGNQNLEILKQNLDQLKARICDDQFEADVNQHNCDYVARFIKVLDAINGKLPDAEYRLAGPVRKMDINGTAVSFDPQLVLTRLTKRNVQKCGALMLRYGKNNTLDSEVGTHQSAFIYVYFRDNPLADSEAEKSLSITIDAFAGVVHEAPGDSVYRHKEMAAACAAIAERWEAIKPPTNARF